jgi:hypothetical protein
MGEAGFDASSAASTLYGPYWFATRTTHNVFSKSEMPKQIWGRLADSKPGCSISITIHHQSICGSPKSGKTLTFGNASAICSAAATKSRHRTSSSKSQILRQHAAANSRHFRSLAFPRKNSNIG